MLLALLLVWPAESRPIQLLALADAELHVHLKFIGIYGVDVELLSSSRCG